MDAKAVIASYVDDVVRRLPRRQRSDVGFELRSLLNEELDGKSTDAGRPADEAMALALLHAFGAPKAVSARYRPPGFTIIEPAHSQAFALWSLIGVAVQWALTLPKVFGAPEAFPGQTFSRLGAWWTSWGLGAFWLPGVMVVIAIIAAWIRHRWPRADAWTPRRAPGRDSVNRPLLAFGLAAWAVGAAIWVAMPWYGPHLPGPLPAVFAFDDGFLGARGPWLLPFWAGQFGVYAMALVDGRWRVLTRRLSLAFGAALYGVLAWFVVAGPIFRNRPTDAAAKPLLAVIVVVSLIVEGVRLYREQGRIRPPHGVTSSPGR
ncbi:MAG TPA: hypothetical protein VN814_02970 [Caulobacteraceae bacterium]|nr:hypothetical protein [Caulobacteraceae bacterium]